jgi:hypothetical protein
MVAAAAALVLALPVLALMHARSEPRNVISDGAATRIAAQDPAVKKLLGDSGYTSSRVTALDGKQLRVSFSRGPRLVALALVGPNGHVSRSAPGTMSQVGNEIAYVPLALILLSLVFAVSIATVPLLSLRNLDVLAFTAFGGVAWLIGRGYVDASMLIAYPLLGYLIARLLWVGLNGPGRQPAESLYWRLTRSWTLGERRRMLGLVVGGLAVFVAALTYTSLGVSDVGFAALAGATNLTHGTVPYEHIPDFIVHGDTYPPLTYAAYVPAAVLFPVTDVFSDPQGALVVTTLATLITTAAVYGLVRRAAGPENTPDREPSEIAGLRAAVAWLAFPPVLLAASSGSNDLILALCLIAALICLSRRATSTLLLGVAAWVKLTPVFALPIWLARMRGRELGTALAGLAALTAVILGGLVAIGGLGSVSSMADAIAFQFNRRSLFSLWTGLDLGALQPVAQALLIAAVAGATVAVRRDASLRDNPLRLAALLSGVMLLSQLAANYWTWAYLPWAIVPALPALVVGHLGREPVPLKRAAKNQEVALTPSARPAVSVG